MEEKSRKAYQRLEEEKKERELPNDHAPNSRKRQKTSLHQETVYVSSGTFDFLSREFDDDEH